MKLLAPFEDLPHLVVVFLGGGRVRAPDLLVPLQQVVEFREVLDRGFGIVLLQVHVRQLLDESAGRGEELRDERLCFRVHGIELLHNLRDTTRRHPGGVALGSRQPLESGVELLERSKCGGGGHGAADGLEALDVCAPPLVVARALLHYVGLLWCRDRGVAVDRLQHLLRGQKPRLLLVVLVVRHSVRCSTMASFLRHLVAPQVPLPLLLVTARFTRGDALGKADVCIRLVVVVVVVLILILLLVFLLVRDIRKLLGLGNEASALRGVPVQHRLHAVLVGARDLELRDHGGVPSEVAHRAL
mmetsp:Transcript_52775/g.125618  ORF Transcript_52775/g.125618 Transcript_52775/m.125618 type:complete len:301 (+) Transcript_52775:1790-2692(+)